MKCNASFMQYVVKSNISKWTKIYHNNKIKQTFNVQYMWNKIENGLMNTKKIKSTSKNQVAAAKEFARVQKNCMHMVNT